jgi:hypothetical protein
MFAIAARQPEGITVSPLASSVPAPTPRLQTDPHADLMKRQQAEDAVLRAYGWVDRATGTVRIPIERAMELLAGRQGGAEQPRQEASDVR